VNENKNQDVKDNEYAVNRNNSKIKDEDETIENSKEKEHRQPPKKTN
jgi:hypothetical protein